MIVNRIHHWARRQPHRLAIVHNGQAISYAAFWRGLVWMRRQLQVERIAAGKTAVVMIDNMLLAWLATLTLRWMGVNTVVVATFDVLATIAIRDAACLVLAAAEEYSPTAAALALAGSKAVVLPPFDVEAGNEVSSIGTVQGGRGYGAHILYTSGTTGRYKTLLFEAAREDGRNVARAAAMRFDNATVFHGFNYGLWSGAGFKQPLAVWQVGGCIVFEQRADPLADFFHHGITKASLLPPMGRQLLAAFDAASDPVPRPQLELNLMSGFLSLDVAQQIVRRITPQLNITYSATELVQVPMETRFRGRDDLDWLEVVPGAAVEVVDELQRPCPLNVEGNLRVGLTRLDCRSYVDDADATRGAFRSGWFYPGDMAVRRADGRVRILGRVADVINLHGQKTAVAPLEQRIQRRLRVDEVCLFVSLNADGQEELMVAVQAAAPLDDAGLAWLREEFADFDSVKIHVLPQFPRTRPASGKVRRSELKRQLLGRD